MKRALWTLAPGVRQWEPPGELFLVLVNVCVISNIGRRAPYWIWEDTGVDFMLRAIWEALWHAMFWVEPCTFWATPD